MRSCWPLTAASAQPSAFWSRSGWLQPGRGAERLVLLALLEEALVHRRLQHQDQALVALAGALDLAAVSGCIRMFVEAGEPMAELLRLALRHDLHPEFTARLLAAFAAEPPASGVIRTPARQLGHFRPMSSGARPDDGTPRPQPTRAAGLDLAAQGLTNEEIAVRLTVALSTVKTHINHICRKLEVPNRTAAAAKARHLHLLADP